jgi:intron-binding protein aquarius
MAPQQPRDVQHDASHRPTLADLQGENHFAQTARNTWLRSGGAGKFRPGDLKKDVWDVLEKNGFQFKSLLILENLQILEKYLWPNYSDEASNIHILLIALIANVKGRESLPVWTIFTDKPSSEFSSLFKRILAMSLDASLGFTIRADLLSFLISAFQSLDSGLVRKECAPLVSISIWHNLSNDKARESRFDKHPQLRKAWRAAGKRLEAADEPTQGKLRFEGSWLYSMTLDFFECLYDPSITSNFGKSVSFLKHIEIMLTLAGALVYCERFLEFLTDIESQLPTRRYVNSLLHDLNLLPVIKMSPIFSDPNNDLFRDMYNLLRHFMHFSIDDHTGLQLSKDECYDLHCSTLAKLQRVAFKSFKDKLTILALSNYSSIDERGQLEDSISALSDDELIALLGALGARTNYPKGSKVVTDRAFFTEVIVWLHERKRTFQETVKDLSILPNEVRTPL